MGRREKPGAHQRTSPASQSHLRLLFRLVAVFFAAAERVAAPFVLAARFAAEVRSAGVRRLAAFVVCADNARVEAPALPSRFNACFAAAARLADVADFLGNAMLAAARLPAAVFPPVRLDCRAGDFFTVDFFVDDVVAFCGADFFVTALADFFEGDFVVAGFDVFFVAAFFVPGNFLDTTFDAFFAVDFLVTAFAVFFVGVFLEAAFAVFFVDVFLEAAFAAFFAFDFLVTAFAVSFVTDFLETAFFVFLAAFFLPRFAGTSTPERRASDNPMAMACLADFTPCAPRRTRSTSSFTNSPACVDADLP